MNKIISRIATIPALSLIIYLIYTNKVQIKCIFHKITNLYCPGCGITRLIISILKLDFYQAFRYNPLVFILCPFFLLYLVYKLYITVFNKTDTILKSIPNKFYYFLLVITIVFGILRNISPFSWMAPTKVY